MRRASIKSADSSKKMQTLQVVSLGDVTDDVEHFEAYGLTSCPQDAPADGRGAETILLDLGDCSDHTVAIVAGDRRYRVTGLAKGEVCLYDDQGQVVHLKRGSVDIVAKAGNAVNVTGPAGIKLKNDVTVTGMVDASTQVKALTGFVAAGLAGKNGTLTVTKLTPLPAPVTTPLLTFVVTGGLVTSVVPLAPWTVAPADVLTFIWVGD